MNPINSQNNTIYTISVADMTEKVCYEDEVTVIDFEVEENAIKAARELAHGLSENYPQCFCVTVFAGEKRLPNGDIVGEPYDIYTISSKTKGETMKARRLAGYTQLEVNEYTEPNKSNKMEKKIVVMNLVALDNDGNVSIDLLQYDSKEAALSAGEEMLNEWLDNQNATLDEEAADTDGLILCTREDYDNLIEVHSTESIAEYNILVKEF